MPQRIQLTEAAALTASPATAMTGHRFMARLIASDVQGSCGYYPAATLIEAANSKVFPAGLQSFVDHPGIAESMDRPERSIRDLAGRLVTDAVMRPDGLYAEIEFYPHMAPVIEAMADGVGMSIRAMGTVEQGDVNGSPGMIVTSLSNASSVDVVTKAGAGGKLVSLLESARPDLVVKRAVAHGVTEATANDTREALQGILRDAYGAEKSWVWVRDFDDSTVWFEVETPDESGTYAQTYTMSADGAAALSGARVEVRARTEYVPVDPVAIAAAAEAAAVIGNTVKCATCGHMASGHADVKAGANMGACSMKGCDCAAMKTPAAKEAAAPTVPVIPAGLPTATTESLEDHMAQIQVDEAEYARVTADAGRVQTLESERDAAIAETARTERAVSVARDTARPIATTLVSESESLPPMVAARVIEAAVASVTIGEAGFDEAAFRVAVEAARTAAETEVASIAEALGVGKVVNFGPSKTNTGEVTEADLDRTLAATFGYQIKEA